MNRRESRERWQNRDQWLACPSRDLSAPFLSWNNPYSSLHKICTRTTRHTTLQGNISMRWIKKAHNKDDDENEKETASPRLYSSFASSMPILFKHPQRSPWDMVPPVVTLKVWVPMTTLPKPLQWCKQVRAVEGTGTHVSMLRGKNNTKRSCERLHSWSKDLQSSRCCWTW